MHPSDGGLENPAAIEYQDFVLAVLILPEAALLGFGPGLVCSFRNIDSVAAANAERLAISGQVVQGGHDLVEPRIAGGNLNHFSGGHFDDSHARACLSEARCPLCELSSGPDQDHGAR